jgi:hypothetical protein
MATVSSDLSAVTVSAPGCDTLIVCLLRFPSIRCCDPDVSKLILSARRLDLNTSRSRETQLNQPLFPKMELNRSLPRTYTTQAENSEVRVPSGSSPILHSISSCSRTHKPSSTVTNYEKYPLPHSFSTPQAYILSTEARYPGCLYLLLLVLFASILVVTPCVTKRKTYVSEMKPHPV